MHLDRNHISCIIGDRIRQFRLIRSLSQEELAFASEINPTYLGRLERGEKCPTADTLYKISLGLKIPLFELLNIPSALEPTNNEALFRIMNALEGLSVYEMIEVAEIVEKIVALKQE